MEWGRFRLEAQPPRFEGRRSIDRRSGGIPDQPSEAIVCLCVCLGNDGLRRNRCSQLAPANGDVACSLLRLPDPLHFVPNVFACRRFPGRSTSVCDRPLCTQFVEKKGNVFNTFPFCILSKAGFTRLYYRIIQSRSWNDGPCRIVRHVGVHRWCHPTPFFVR